MGDLDADMAATLIAAMSDIALVVDTDGIIRYAHWDPNYEKRIDAQDLLEAARDAVE